jgi:thioesterase domain-containing protein
VSAGALLSELRRRDIQVQAVGSELRCSAPAGALTPELREQLRQHKADLLALLASAQALAGQARAIVPLRRNGKRTPVFGVPGHNGDVFCYRALAQCLGEDQPFFGLQPPGLDGEGEPLTRVEDLAAYFAGQMRAFRPEGPYVIAGFCAGGAVAFELAQQLLGSGAGVPLLALFGSPHPVYFSRRTQLWRRLVKQVERVRKHGRGLLSRSWSERRRYFAEELRERKARLDGERAAAVDPVLALRFRVEQATVRAVRRYAPRPFAGRFALFLPGREWQRSGVAARRWRPLAKRVEEYFGPDASTGTDMLREPHAAAFADLFRRCYGRVGGNDGPCGRMRVKSETLATRL